MKETIHNFKYRLFSLIFGILLFVCTLIFLFVVSFRWNFQWYSHYAQLMKIIGCALLFLIAIPHIVFGCIPYHTKNMKAIILANSIIATLNLIWLGLSVYFFSKAPQYGFTVILVILAFLGFLNLLFLLEPKPHENDAPSKLQPSPAIRAEDLLAKGILSPEEYDTLLKQSAPKDPMLVKIDQLKNMEKQGMISKEEFAQLLQKLF